MLVAKTTIRMDWFTSDDYNDCVTSNKKRWCPLVYSTSAKWRRRSSGSRFEIELNINTTVVSRGTFLNTTGLAFSLGIAVAYLVIILNSLLHSPPSSVFGQLTNLIMWIWRKLQFEIVEKVGGATSWRLAGLVPPVVCCVATPILFIMKVFTNFN